MRPITLQLSAFGSYAGEEHIDFRPLAELGLFVVTGPTGTGKTTLFDAMAFALYGKLPGGRPDGEVRSHHAEPTERTWVSLEFEMEGTRWRVRREPAQDRPKRGGGVTTQPATAELFEWVENDWVGRESRATAVSAGCSEILGLDLSQFERVVLLPQGKFQQFLLADTRERLPLLAQLFGTRLYREAVDRLKRRSAELAGLYTEVGNTLEHHRLEALGDVSHLAAGLDTSPPNRDAPLEDLASSVVALAVPLASAYAVLATLQQDATRARAAVTKAVALAAQWAQRAEGLRQLAELEIQQVEREVDRAALADARRAIPVVEADTLVQSRRADLGAARADLDTASTTLDTAAVTLGLGGFDPTNPAAAGQRLSETRNGIEQRRQILTDLEADRTELASAVAAVLAAEEHQRELDERQGRVERDQAELTTEAGTLSPIAAAAVERAATLQSVTQRVQRRDDLARDEPLATAAVRAAQEAFDLRNEVLRRFVVGAAPRLAAALIPHEPCPVCGSTTHPAPAKADTEAEQVEKYDVDAAMAAADEAAIRSKRLTEAVASAVEELGDDARRPLQELRDDCERAHAAADESAAAAARVDAIVGERAVLESRRAELAGVVPHMAATLAEVRMKAQQTGSRVDTLTAAAGGDTLVAIQARLGVVDSAVESLGRVQGARDHVASAQGALGTAEQVLVAALRISGFVDLEAAQDAAVESAPLAELAAVVTTFDLALADTRTRLEVLTAAALPDERPDTGALEHTADATEEHAATETDRVALLADRARTALAAIENARTVEAGAVALRHQRDVAKLTASTCDGQGPGRIALETWVLGGELDRVAEAASVHLATMTANRYRLERTDDAGHRGRQAGLDLRIFDSHTGRTRGTGTLSGGEQFQASLALALGLADVVSQGGRGTGHVYEALFVDEGFGSLDLDALDQAVQTLDQLRAGGRMVGVITHVDVLKQTLPVGIEVRRRPDDRGSTLRTPA